MSLPHQGDPQNGDNAPLDPSYPPNPIDPVVATPSTFAPFTSFDPLSNGTVMPPQQQPGYPQFSEATAQLLARAKANVAAHHAGTASYEAAREQLMKQMVTSDSLPVPSPSGTPKRGRGRGRGRGAGAGRSSDVASTPGSTSTPVSERGKGRVGRPRGRGRGGGRGGKRKRSESAESDGDDDSDVSDSYTPLPAKTKSGRSVNKPTQYVPVIPEPAREGKKRRPYRRNIEAAVCKMCNRGTSPSTNQIVFCDGCGTPYHQYCHDPPIEADVVDIPDKEWFCSACVKSREEPEAPNAEGLVTGDGLNADEKRARLSTLPQSRIIDLLIQASSIHPTLAIFPASTSTSTTVPTQAPAAGTIDIDGDADAAAEPYDGYDTDPPAHYPKPGNGVARTLRPETEDLQWLVDDNTDVFSHQSNYPGTTNGNGTAPMTAAPVNTNSEPVVTGAGDVSMGGV